MLRWHLQWNLDLTSLYITKSSVEPFLFIRLLQWGFSYHPGLVEFCSYFDRWLGRSLPKEISLDLILLKQELLRSVASIYAHALVQLRQENKFFFRKSIFITWKSEWLIPRSHYIGDFVLVITQLSFYYSTILRVSLAFFRKECILPTTPQMGKINNN